MRIRTDRLLSVDLELTCWEGPPPPGQIPEIIQIAVVEVDTSSLEVTRSGSWYVRPKLSTVSPFCTNLTGIQPETIQAEGRHLPELFNRIRKEYGPGAKSWIAWGRDDRIIAEACDRLGVENPFSSNFLNIGQMWSLMMGQGQRISQEQAMEYLGIVPEGRLHDALADALGCARVFSHIARTLRPASPEFRY
jgi:inhibitor of KinA sporulation pathway (predicted exonuclease)